MGYLLTLLGRFPRDRALSTDVNTDAHQMGFAIDFDADSCKKIPDCLAIFSDQIQLDFVGAFGEGTVPGFFQFRQIFFFEQ